MIEVENLVKRFYDVLAVDDISFEVGRGEVVGFLGPNGAGKSTTLKILTCFIPASSGSARIAGLDVFRESMAVREQVGYLPESVPLYPDMRVNEYLFFRGRLKGLSVREARTGIDDVCDVCGLSDMKKRIVGQLSKGYKQRVGLADVLINRPPILLLDEPTAGLDPSQRKEVRELIARLGEDHTILLSSHILAEVETVCNRVMIIKKGKIIADGEPKGLVKDLKGGERLRIEASCPSDVLINALKKFPESVEITDSEEEEGCSTVMLLPQKREGFNKDILGHLVSIGVPVKEFSTRRFTLEEIFIHLTVEDEVLSQIHMDGGEKM